MQRKFVSMLLIIFMTCMSPIYAAEEQVYRQVCSGQVKVDIFDETNLLS